MIWTIKDKGKVKYIKKRGGVVFLSRDKREALDDIPEGWEVVRGKNGELKAIPKE